jgi:hypothetical protein
LTDLTEAAEAIPEVITDHQEVLLRQVHPIHNPNGVLSSGAFRPGPSHQGKLSTHRGYVGAEEAYLRWTAQDYPSCGTWGISVGEAHGLALPALADDVLPGMPADHASVDFEGCASSSEIKRKAKLLRDHANERARLYPAAQELAE